MELKHIDIARLSVSPVNMRGGRKAPDLIHDLGAGRMASAGRSLQHHASAHDQVFGIDYRAFILRQDLCEPAGRKAVHGAAKEKSHDASDAPV
ncbi:hypothetical protein [Sphingobium aquiterrae]|uniref:hypothetical protein n=1 Tax=Sphingobium aquiterrae TaxID=2038656 RepID=UPI003019732A